MLVSITSIIGEHLALNDTSNLSDVHYCLTLLLFRYSSLQFISGWHVPSLEDKGLIDVRGLELLLNLNLIVREFFLHEFIQKLGSTCGYRPSTFLKSGSWKVTIRLSPIVGEDSSVVSYGGALRIL